MAKKKSIGAVLTLKDGNFSTKMRETNKNWTNFQKGAKKSDTQLQAFERRAKSTGSALGDMAKGFLGVAAAYVGFNATKDFLTSSVDAAKESIDASTKLYTVMKNTAGVTDKQIDGLINYADAMQKVGVVEGDALVAGMQQVGTFQLQASTIKTLTPGMADLLAQQKGLNATSEDAVSVGNLMGKVMNGQTSALSRVGVNFTKAQEQILKYGTESEKAATLSAVLKMNVGGVNAALREDDQGKIQGMVHSWGDMKEVIGMAVLPAMAKFATAFEKYIPNIQRGLERGIKSATGKFDKAFKYVENTYLNNPKFKNLTFSGKINFVLDDISEQFQKWLNNGGSDKVREFGSAVGTLVGEGFIAVAPKLFETAGKMVVASFVAGLKNSTMGALIAGVLAGAGTGAAIGALGGPIGMGGGGLIGGVSALITHAMVYDTSPAPINNMKYSNTPVGDFRQIDARSNQSASVQIDHMFNKIADQVVIREEADLDKLAGKFATKLKGANHNYGGGH